MLSINDYIPLILYYTVSNYLCNIFHARDAEGSRRHVQPDMRIIPMASASVGQRATRIRGKDMEEIPKFDVLNAKFSLFSAGINTQGGQKPYMQGTLKDVYTWMNSQKMVDLTHELRSIKDEKEQKAFKAERLPFVTFSGQFSYRNAKGLIQHSGLLCFDIDHLANEDEVWHIRKLLQEDVYFDTDFMFTSPRGTGVKWVTHIDLARGTHEQWYAAIREYLRRTYGIEADPLPANVASACFLCFDANLVVNSIVAPF